MKKIIFKNIISLILLIFFTKNLFAFDKVNQDLNNSSNKEKNFNAGEMIIEHIKDAYEWHLFTIGNKHITIPLPVILVYNNKIDIFLSSKFQHGHSSYKGYKLETEGKYKGKIVRVKEDGKTIDENAPKILDFSITKNVLAIFISVILLCVIFIYIARVYTKRGSRAAPKGLQSALEVFIVFIRDDIAIPSIGKEKYEKFMPYLLSLFFFIFFNNLLGLVPFFPGGANVTGNLSVTMVLAVFTFVITTISGNRNYWKHIFNPPGVPIWLKIPPIMPIVEL
ncbi:MAG TPA: F0F1 ATP synthase subunit A, partial [Bacteroidales bacterium]|nr:F0F1 ATP synthase subunit A [Bacteroidales bacterium]